MVDRGVQSFELPGEATGAARNTAVGILLLLNTVVVYIHDAVPPRGQRLRASHIQGSARRGGRALGVNARPRGGPAPKAPKTFCTYQVIQTR